MTTYISKLFEDICKRGCVIEIGTTYEYMKKILPKCLVSVDKNLPERRFVIRSIIPNSNRIDCIITSIGYLYQIEDDVLYSDDIGYLYQIEDDVLYSDDMDYAINLDLITYYVHNKHDVSQVSVPSIDQLIENLNTMSLENISNYKQILKNKMIENLTELYLIKFMYLTSSMISLAEIKIVIVEILFKLDKWDNL